VDSTAHGFACAEQSLEVPNATSAQQPNTAALSGVEVLEPMALDIADVLFPRRRHAAALPTGYVLPTDSL